MEKELNLIQKNTSFISDDSRMLLIGSFVNLWDEEYIARTFEKLGWYVKRLEASKTSLEDVLQEIETKKYRFLFTVNRQIQGNFSEILGKIKTVFWLFDLYCGTPREVDFNFNPRFRCDYVFSTDGGHQAEFLQSRISHYVLRQGIYEEDAYIGESKEHLKSDIVFVGTFSSALHVRRREMIEDLQNTFKENFKWWGQSGANEIRGPELNDLYASTKIVVGDSAPSPNYWSTRIYDVLGRGGFLIHPAIEGLEKEFKYYKHFVPFEYGNFDDLKKKIEYYLEHNKTRENIRKSGFKFCKKNHNFKSRCIKLLETINEI